MTNKLLRTPGVLGTAIIVFTGGVMLLLTAYKYSQRDDGTASVRPASLKPDIYEVTYQQLNEVQPFELIERSGEPVGWDDLRGEPLVFSFFFSRCPSVCKQQNSAIQRLRLELKDVPVRFVSVSCDPAYDTPEVLREYAEQFNADPEQWLFLTGALDKVVALGRDSFSLPVGPETHSTSLLLVDKWGRFRDRFDWKETSELLRFKKVIEEVVSEDEPAGEMKLTTRAPVPADDVSSHGADADADGDTAEGDGLSAKGEDEAWREKPWIDEFTLTDSLGQPFGTADLEGKVWVANTFFTRCPTICTKLMTEVQQLQQALGDKPVEWVSISTDSTYDTPSRLKAYGEKFDQDPARWHLLTGDPLYCRRVMSEYLKLFVEMEGPEHDEHLVLLDKWGQVRGTFAYDDSEQIAQLRRGIDRLLQETERPADAAEAERQRLLDEARRAELEAEGLDGDALDDSGQ